MDDWAIFTARRWWCKECRRFTFWEFQDIQNEDEPGRCSECRQNEDAAYWAAINEMRGVE